ncbi:hypothetical protein ElP_30930 [Tautonia plasticadhaerens]|uniref:Uncharacterized protein n=1 Tax=Tautonia plasticadhaerens TaxID=2527974 RepID=A0A518H2Y6_9BACT|nr:hypothetical protein ElP_30930 [Tautonia plasticadhaerens]
MPANRMTGNGRTRLDLRAAEPEELRQVMDLGVREALSRHKEEGRAVAVWDYRRGEVQFLPPDQIGQPEGAALVERPEGPADGPESTG